MKTISNALTNFFLDNTSFGRADLITILLPNGHVLSVLYGTNATTITYPTGMPATVTVLGTAYPWSPTDPNYPFTASGGTAAASLPILPGQIVNLVYQSGLVDFHFTSGIASDADGRGPTPGGSLAPGDLYINPHPTEISLIGGFADGSGHLIAPPFLIGNRSVIGPAPAGTTQLLMGPNDYPYSDNTGSWVMAVSGSTYYSSKFGAWERGPFTNKASHSPSPESMELKALLPESLMFPGTSTAFMQAINSGILNGAKVYIQTLFWPSGGQPSDGISMGTMQLMQGQIGNVKNAGRSKIVCEVYDLTYMLNRPFPPHSIQTACRHSLFDAGCGLAVGAFMSSPSVPLGGGSTTLYLNLNIAGRLNSTGYTYGDVILLGGIIYMCITSSASTAAGAPVFNSQRGATTLDGGVTWRSMAGAYPLGWVLFKTGQNAGLRMSVKTQALVSGVTQFQLIKPLPFAVSPGDLMTIVPGCDWQIPTCLGVYNNLIHFGGSPYVPNPEIAQ